MKRVISLYLPTWPTDRLRHQRGNQAPSVDAPLVISGVDGRKQVIVALDQKALKLGLHIGMTITQAQAMLPGLHVEKADPAADHRALERIAFEMLQFFSPVVAFDEPDGLMIDATGAAHLWGGEKQMLDEILCRLKKRGIAARAAMAPTYGATYALARFGLHAQTIVDDSNMVAAIRHLPIAGLRLTASTTKTLQALGIETIGELGASPRAGLARRFGKEIGERLDQLHGRRTECFALAELPNIPCIREAFAEPIATPEAIHFVIGKLVEAICNEFENRVIGARRLDLLFERVDNTTAFIRIGLAKPDRDVKRLMRLLVEQVVTIDPGFGIEVMRLSAPWSEPLTYTQDMASFGAKPRPDASSLIDTLRNRLGPQHVFQMVLTESDVPERSFIRIDPAVLPQGQPSHESRPRPLRLLARPEPIETMALLPDHPPVSFTWRGTRRKVRCADGPERIHGEWWTRDTELEAVRDYFRVEDENGERFWVYRSGDGQHAATGSRRWYLHGFFA